ncbi:MAG: hypothetical protein HRT58_12435 [Crocinitomicaceae bacterium]|nr:hypothetical protein [Flavobacteriales bacterium]NQZ36470.1 hypothetical protein [Crocinitomicaceae bacterium]
MTSINEIPEKIVSLIKALTEKTLSKNAIWSKSSQNNEFKLFLEKGAVTTAYLDNTYGNDSVDFSIYNVHGDRIDGYNAVRTDPNFAILLDLYNSAKREFYKVDETITSLFDQVRNDGEIGKRLVDEAEDDDLPF